MSNPASASRDLIARRLTQMRDSLFVCVNVATNAPYVSAVEMSALAQLEKTTTLLLAAIITQDGNEASHISAMLYSLNVGNNNGR